MSTTRLGKLEVLPVRQVWPLEDEDFTPWLAENLEMLGDLLRMELDLNQSQGGMCICRKSGTGLGVSQEGFGP